MPMGSAGSKEDGIDGVQTSRKQKTPLSNLALRSETMFLPVVLRERPAILSVGVNEVTFVLVACNANPWHGS